MILAIPSRHSTEERFGVIDEFFSLSRNDSFGVSDSEESGASLDAVEEEDFEDIPAGNGGVESPTEEDQQPSGALTGVGSSENGGGGPSRTSSQSSSRTSQSSQTAEDSESGEQEINSSSESSSSDDDMSAVGGKYVTVPAFAAKPGEDADKWLERFEEAAAYNSWNDEKMCRNVYVALNGAAKAWANRMKNGPNPPERWSTVQQAVRQTREGRQTDPNAAEILPIGQGIRERFIEEFMSDNHLL